MKPPIDDKFKAAFFNIYTFCGSNGRGVKTDGKGYDNAYIVLKALDNITDEEAVSIANRCLGLLSGTSYLLEKAFTDKVVYIKIQNTRYSPCEKEFGSGLFYLPLDVFDHLRSQGYNCGYLGYSPQELVDAGIVRYENQ